MQPSTVVAQLPHVARDGSLDKEALRQWLRRDNTTHVP
jgi:hypothetical protein